MRGANDVIRLGALTRAVEQIKATLGTLKQCVRTTVVVTNANVGGAPIFFWPPILLYSNRSLSLARAIESCADQAGARYVNLYFPLRDDVFARAPHLYFSEDAVHPSDAAYAIVYWLTKARVFLDSALNRSRENTIHRYSNAHYS
jgi:lysophospholipase L1-like esterase